MPESRENFQAIKNEILKRKDDLIIMPPRHSVVSDNTLTMQLSPWRKKLIEVYANSMTTSPEGSKASIEEWGTEVSGLLVNLQFPLDVGLNEISYYRNSIGEIVRDEAIRQEMTLTEFYSIVSEFDTVVDHAIQIVSRSYMEEFHRSIETAKYAIDELSVPVVQLTKDTGVIPIIGEIDTNRARYLMLNSLEQGAEMELSRLILDLSGVSIVDTMVAGQIFKVIDSLKLIGIEAVLSGVRPEVAQTMVNLGIRVEGKVYSSLRKALEDKSIIIK
ncbi:STAS domain-containing protein [Alkalicoccobacillus murimartini]|uniref:RsbT co-antagonist protein RsbR n=1 Tax=Alkalicoccobacillus murimartini TaxID=171685 RepID=A0ABT9YMK0_9BACI|nr:STAS domain-containing protein [Alkalicoccobacillus murimartini]MDQ0208726.1 rsbT co-antagonist protein RsbR [Alkalicoccobacillus murimartini]